jgi:hypothetical protein
VKVLLLVPQTAYTKFSVVLGQSRKRKVLQCEEMVSHRGRGYNYNSPLLNSE